MRCQSIVQPVQGARAKTANLVWPKRSRDSFAETFEAEVRLYVELEQYTIQERGSPNLLRGQVRARIQVVETGAEANPVYESIVETRFPEHRPVAEGEVSPRRIRAVVTRLFARDVVRRFYDHEVPLEEGTIG
jgi:hypothetical protein